MSARLSALNARAVGATIGRNDRCTIRKSVDAIYVFNVRVISGRSD